MKLSKYITALVLTAVITIYLNIFSVNDLPHSVPNGCHVEFDGIRQMDFIEMSELAQKENLIFSAVDDENVSILTTEAVFYTESDQTDLLWKKYLGLKPCTAGDILGNERILRAGRLEDIAGNEEAQSEVNFCYLFGDRENCEAWVKAVSEAGERPRVSYPKFGSEEAIPFLMFALMLVLLLFYSYMDASFEKKEVSIRVLHGDSIVRQFVHCALTDTIVFSMILCGALVIQTLVSPMLRFYQSTYLLILPFLAGIWLVDAQLLRLRPKEILYGTMHSQKLLTLLSFVKCVVSAAACFVLLSLGAEVTDLRKYQKADAFFTQHSDYDFLTLALSDTFMNEITANPESIHQMGAMKRQFYTEADSDLESICLLPMEGSFESYDLPVPDWQPIFCNWRALPYAQSLYPAAAEADLNTFEAAMLVPDTLSEEDKNLALDIFTDKYNAVSVKPLEPQKVQNITYRPDEEMLYFADDGSSHFAFARNPVLFITSPNGTWRNLDFLEGGSIYRRLSPEREQELLEGVPLRAVATNVLEQYDIEYQTRRNLARIALMLCALTLVLFVLITYTILRLDYKVNAVELAVKKVMGFPVWEKNRKHFIMDFCVMLLNLGIAALLVFKARASFSPLLLGIPAVIFAAQTVLLFVLIQRIERTAVPKILKGGAL